MTATPISDGINKGMIEEQRDYEECDHCDGKIGYVTYNPEEATYEYTDDDDGVKVCKDCHTTPNGNLLDVDQDHVDDKGIAHWPYEHTQDASRDTYSTYSVNLGKKPVILYGGFEEAYRDPENSLAYCLEEYGENPHHDGLIIWG